MRLVKFRLVGATSAAAFILFSVGVSPAFAGTTGWLNRDTPGGVGEYEDTANHLRIECQTTSGKPAPVGPGYTCEVSKGGICVNKEVRGGTCVDLRVRYLWNGGATPWLNRDNPGGLGDYEDTANLLGIVCERNPGPGPAPVGTGHVCTSPVGGVCVNAQAQPSNPCVDIKVRYTW